MRQLPKWWLLHRKNAMTDYMAIIGIICAVWFCVAQIKQTFITTKGVAVAQYVAFTASMLLGFLLALNSYRREKGRIIFQQLLIFGTWSVLGLVLIAVVLIFASDYQWRTLDTVTAISAGIGFAATMSWVIAGRAKLSDPSIKAWNGIFLKSVPQVFLAYLILIEGGAGITTSAIVVGLISIAMRLIPLAISRVKEGADKDKLWLLIADGANGASWFLVTIVWVIVEHL